MIQFSIIIPFRPKAESNNWASECELLHQTVSTVLRQTYTAIKVYVIYTDAPEQMITTDPRLQYVSFPYGYQTFDEIESREELLIKFKSAIMVVRRWDKARKQMFGCDLAKKEGADYIMSLDADDLLSKYFFSHLSQHADGGNCPGWYMNKGYVYKPSTNYFMRVPKNMRSLNGSTHVLKADLIKTPDFSSSDWQQFNLFTDHGWVKERLKRYLNIDLQAIEKSMLVYVVHGSNISKVNQKEYGLTIKNIAKKILRGVILTKTIRDEYNIQKQKS